MFTACSRSFSCAISTLPDRLPLVATTLGPKTVLNALRSRGLMPNTRIGIAAYILSGAFTNVELIAVTPEHGGERKRVGHSQVYILAHI